MDLCSTHYGFLHLPSLVAFTNPHSPYSSVARLFMSGTSLLEMARHARSLDVDQRRDFAHRATTWFHERRHFHDVLLTPLGNALFFAELSRAAALLPWLPKLQSFKGQILELPMSADTPGMRSFVDAYQPVALPYASLIASARDTMEASAVLAQLAFAMRYVSDTAFVALMQDFLREPRYGYPIQVLGDLVGAPTAATDARRVFVAYARLLLLVMSDPPVGRKQSHDATLRKLMDKARQVDRSKLASTMESIVQTTWRDVRRNLLLNEERTERWLGGLEHPLRLRGIPGELAEMFRRVAREFAGASVDMRRRVCEKPEDYCDLSRYIEADWPEPLTALFHSDGSFRFTDVGARWCPFTRESWSQFAVALAPLGVLVEDPAFRHPLVRPWRANLEQNVGVRLARPSRSLSASGCEQTEAGGGSLA